MSNIKPDEMALLKAVSIKLDDNTMFIVTLQYHTEKGDRSKSRYRWLGRVCRIEDVARIVAEYKLPENKLNPWRWPNDPSWTGKILYTDSDCSHAASWLRSKMNKMVDWETGVKALNGYDKKKNEYFEAKKYDTDGFMTEDGSTISILDKDALIARVGQNVWKEQTKKAKLAKQPNENASQVADSLTNIEQPQAVEPAPEQPQEPQEAVAPNAMTA